MEVDPSDMVGDFKQRLANIADVQGGVQNLLLWGMHLNDKTLGEYDIPEKSIVYLNPEVVKP